uniref:Uncharacterized protein n=1 Tax=Opuntia streptacantha TaxID=393608 RepID=A0A7C9EEJ1_OPUST
MTIYAKIRIYYPYWRILEIGLYFLFRTYLPDRRGSSYCDLVSDLLNITAWSYCYSELFPECFEAQIFSPIHLYAVVTFYLFLIVSQLRAFPGYVVVPCSLMRGGCICWC